LSQEFQIIEHGLGEYWTQATSAFDIRAYPKTAAEAVPRWNPDAPWMEFTGANNHALAGTDEDRPGYWNTVELGGRIPPNELREWIDHSYELVAAGLRKKR